MACTTGAGSRYSHKVLQPTGTHPLVEVKPGDEFWGTGQDGKGGNMNGVMLMEIRADLVEEISKSGFISPQW